MIDQVSRPDSHYVSKCFGESTIYSDKYNIKIRIRIGSAPKTNGYEFLSTWISLEFNSSSKWV